MTKLHIVMLEIKFLLMAIAHAKDSPKYQFPQARK